MEKLKCPPNLLQCLVYYFLQPHYYSYRETHTKPLLKQTVRCGIYDSPWPSWQKAGIQERILFTRVFSSGIFTKWVHSAFTNNGSGFSWNESIYLRKTLAATKFINTGHELFLIFLLRIFVQQTHPSSVPYCFPVSPFPRGTFVTSICW